MKEFGFVGNNVVTGFAWEVVGEGDPATFHLDDAVKNSDYNKPVDRNARVAEQYRETEVKL
jgi:hypothetical protein